MSVIKVAISLVALLVAGWLSFDGTRALVTGDFVTPRSGPRAGQLGLWAEVVSAIGIDPRSKMMKCTHVFLGLLWLIALLTFFIRPSLGWYALVTCSILSLW